MLGLLDDAGMSRERFIAAFLEPPLRNTKHAQGFGTLYTAAYFLEEGRVEYRWPGFTWRQSFDRFEPSTRGLRGGAPRQGAAWPPP